MTVGNVQKGERLKAMASDIGESAQSALVRQRVFTPVNACMSESH